MSKDQISILVVDDEREILFEVCSFLIRRGLKVVAAAGVKEAIAALSRERFVAVLTDMRMLDGTGLDVLRAANESDPSSLKLLMTGQSSEDDLTNARCEGVRDILFKPLSLTKILSAIVGRNAGAAIQNALAAPHG